MAMIEEADGFATVRARGRLYAYRVRGRGRAGVVLWTGGRGDDPDQVFTVPGQGHRAVPVFVTGRQARGYARRRGLRLADTAVDTLELARLWHWLDDPVGRKVPPGAVLNAWNFFEDLARGLDAAHRLPEQGAVHNSAYEKLFGNESATWDPGERHAVLELLTAGADLWHTCPVIGKPW
ncbi:hypothetical protein [Streptomyces sp. NPDC051569]|uniref:hypothetical protein n=1 Tax=Streptomyces sp. NPDC051569 TaxID=3365661 RepID=UPI003793CB7C